MIKYEWRKEPPNHDEWLEANNNGYWWVKFKLTEEEREVENGVEYVWPETWYVDCVYVTWTSSNGGRLMGKGSILKDFYLDEPLEGNAVWQPVKPPEEEENIVQFMNKPVNPEDDGC